MKNMLSKEDVVKACEIVREEIRVADLATNKDLRRLQVEVANFKIDVVESFEEIRGEIASSTNRILTTIDAYAKKNETLEVEQKAHASQLDRHEAWIQKTDKKFRISR